MNAEPAAKPALGLIPTRCGAATDSFLTYF